ncbi:MAG: hydrogenase, partial [Bdellovibrionaceae bacterium]|nr:hydrogenase [Pseudobdellovibrionaceae bacterium]
MIKRNQLVLGNKTYADITNDICELVERIPGWQYFAGLLGAKSLFLVYILAQGVTIA